MLHTFFTRSIAIAGSLALLGCDTASETEKLQDVQIAPGTPGLQSNWSYGGKSAIGTSYEAYSNGTYATNDKTGAVSKVWFSTAKGILTEVMYGLIHQAQIKDARIAIVGTGPDGKTFLDFEDKDTDHAVDYLKKDAAGRPASLAVKLVNTDKNKLYTIEKHFFTDPDTQSLMMRVKITPAQGVTLTPYLIVNPHMDNSGMGDKGSVSPIHLAAKDNGTHMAVISKAGFAKASVGFKGVSDGETDLRGNNSMDWSYTDSGKASGNIILTGQLNKASQHTFETDITFSFGSTLAQAQQQGRTTLNSGYDKVLAAFNGEGAHVGWEDYLASLPHLGTLQNTSTDGGKLLNTSMMVLKAQEDKTNAGALIASLSNPWGDHANADKGGTGYKAVWPRDFYQVAMAFMAAGDFETAKAAFAYLPKVQVKQGFKGPEGSTLKGASGWFLQKTEVDGTPEWISIQMDQTAMPIMLGWRLWKAGHLSDAEAKDWYHKMIKPAADFLARGGKVELDWMKVDIKPPYTKQERWEEQAGHSPSTTAAVIAGLVSASDFAAIAGDEQARALYLNRADFFEKNIEATMFTTKGTFKDGRYFVRITANTDPNDKEKLLDNNSRPGLSEDQILDGGFLELVRYGLRSANNPHILDTIDKIDDITMPDALRIKYNFSFPNIKGSFPGWRRYGNDGYGENLKSGTAYGSLEPVGSMTRGRIWPFFTGERGHYELAASIKNKGAYVPVERDRLRGIYVTALEQFANAGMMLPEQIWDGVGNNEKYNYTIGEGTHGATPLAWTHAEYVKLLRSLTDGQVWDEYPAVKARYQKK